MKVSKAIIYFFIIYTAITFNSCKVDEEIIVDDIEINEVVIKENEQLASVVPTSEISTFLSGIITDELRNPLNEVEVSYGNTTVFTTSDGRFTFGQIQLNYSYAFVKAQKEGYLLGSRTFTPTENAFNTISIQLLDKRNPKTFNASIGGQLIIDSDIELSFPANSIVKKDGSAFNGNVYVFGRYLSPNAENLSEIMPGILAGLTNEGTIEPMISYGMFTIELEDEAGNELEIEGNSLVEVKAPAASNDPTTIPLWHFNETYGLWIEAGSAIKVNDQYVSEVNHFSTWNLDINVSGFDVEILLQDQNFNEISNQKIDIYNQENIQLASVYTNDKGRFRLLNAPQNLLFKLAFDCELIEIEKLLVSGANTLDINILTEEARVYTFQGKLTDCENSNTFPLANTYFTIVAENDPEAIYYGGITDENGDYSLTRILCDVDENVVYNLKATVLTESITVKDTLFSTALSGDYQIFDVNFCNIIEDSIADEFVIPFQDESFEQRVRLQVNKPIGDIVYGDVKNLKVLNFDNLGIENIIGIEYFTLLENVNLNYNTITDLSPISDLEYLRSLVLNNNLIEDVSTISNLNSLQYLHLSNNSNITDISALENLNNLVILDLSKNAISDLNALYGLTDLTSLKLDNNNISNIESFTNLTNLVELTLHDNRISNISPLSSLTNLKTLTLYANNDLADISALSTLVNLEGLDLSFINTSNSSPLNIASLSGMNNLVYLKLDQAHLIDITALTSLVNLRELYLANNEIANIDALTNLEALLILDLQSSEITDISPLSNLINLEILNLNITSAFDKQPIVNLSSIRVLNLLNTNISNSDLHYFNDLDNLKDLDLGHNNISDVTELCNLSNSTIQYINLVENSELTIQKVEELRACLPNATIAF